MNWPDKNVEKLVADKYALCRSRLKSVVTRFRKESLSECNKTELRPINLLQTGEAKRMLSVGDVEEKDCIPPQEKKELVHLYKANLKTVDTYWEYVQKEYILSLKERHQTDHKDSNKGLRVLPNLEDVVLVKEPNLRREEWKLGRVTGIQKRNNGYIKNVEAILPNKKVVVRPYLSSFRLKAVTSLFSK